MLDSGSYSSAVTIGAHAAGDQDAAVIQQGRRDAGYGPRQDLPAAEQVPVSGSYTARFVCLTEASVSEAESSGTGAAGLALQAITAAPAMSPSTIIRGFTRVHIPCFIVLLGRVELGRAKEALGLASDDQNRPVFEQCRRVLVSAFGHAPCRGPCVGHRGRTAPRSQPSPGFPVTSTRPSPSRVAVCRTRPSPRLPAADQVPVAGS